MSKPSAGKFTRSGFADLEDFHEHTREQASPNRFTSPSSPRARQNDLDVRMEVLMQSSTNDPEQLSIIERWLNEGLDARRRYGHAPSQSGDRLFYDLSIPSPVSENPEIWERLGNNAPETVRRARVEVRHPIRRSGSEGAGSLLSRQIDELVESLNNTERLNDSLTRNGRYSKVSVLPIMFEDVEPGFELEEELNGLEKCFVQHFNFHVYEIFKIPTTNAQGAVERTIRELIGRHGKKDELVIVVYAGHGIDTRGDSKIQSGRGPAMWAARAAYDPTNLVDWSSIQPSLHIAPCDTLIILNCCFAGNAALGGMKGTNEILAASDRQSLAYIHERSFMRAVIKVLTELKSSRSSLTINMIRDRLDSYNRNDRNEWEWIASPYHKRYPNLDHPSIKLQALPNPNTAIDRPTTSTQTPLTPSSFYVKVSLDSHSNVSLAEWSSCFGSASYPSDIELQFVTEESLRKSLEIDTGK
ncbi:hypothetical protein PV10_00088 [Exophiala mesophila]|uniref:Peptidase C14 caspase domain-containing protein n=1 Tax=Exophiala mesophila TaxID=212818 RepID=A0A0D1ZNH3_EXOME|nr:uncharacterized protein PV10_00088 [Exophiala mesophila]KIV96192.1 hypothetical protein PV10_00088 [Exophiala mesophila]